MRLREIPVDPTRLNSWFGSPTSASYFLTEQVRDVLDRLPEQQRDVVELMFYGRYRKVEVAEQLGLSRSYVHKLWLRARETIREECRDLFSEA